MSKITIYHLKSCDTCRKAVKALSGAGHDLDAIDVRADGVPAAVLADIEKSVGWETLLNTRSTTWRGLDDSAKADMNASKALALMGDHPTLIKRPVISDGKTITIGWKQAAQDLWL